MLPASSKINRHLSLLNRSGNAGGGLIIYPFFRYSKDDRLKKFFLGINRRPHRLESVIVCPGRSHEGKLDDASPIPQRII
jgi:hypothetical protein